MRSTPPTLGFSYGIHVTVCESVPALGTVYACVLLSCAEGVMEPAASLKN
jgi:hypothetical protein